MYNHDTSWLAEKYVFDSQKMLGDVSLSQGLHIKSYSVAIYQSE